MNSSSDMKDVDSDCWGRYEQNMILKLLRYLCAAFVIGSSSLVIKSFCSCFPPPVETEGGVCCGDWRRSQWTLRGQRTDLWHSTAGQGEDPTDLPAKVWFLLHTAVQGYRNWLVDSLFIVMIIIIFHETSLGLKLMVPICVVNKPLFQLPVALPAELIPFWCLCSLLCTHRIWEGRKLCHATGSRWDLGDSRACYHVEHSKTL